MKKGYILLLLLVLLIFQFVPSVAAQNEKVEPYEAYGLCVVSKIMEYNEKFNMDAFVDLETYDKIISFWFGAKTVANASPTNADAIYDLSRFAPEVVSSKYRITQFKDFGFIKKQHRYAYRIMCNAGFLDYEREFLFPNYRLSFRKLFELLMHFEEYAKINHNYDISYGLITDSFSEKNNIIIKQSTNSGENKFEFSRMHSFYVQEGRSLLPYSYNLKRGSLAKIYSLNDEIIFVSLPLKENKLNSKYEIMQARMYLCNEYDKEIIFINNASESYMVYKYNEDTLIFEDEKTKTISDINVSLIDRHCYFITDKQSNTIKYINITG